MKSSEAFQWCVLFILCLSWARPSAWVTSKHLWAGNCVLRGFLSLKGWQSVVSNNSKTPVLEGCLTIRLTPMVSSLAAFREAEYQHTVCMLYLGWVGARAKTARRHHCGMTPCSFPTVAPSSSRTFISNLQVSRVSWCSRTCKTQFMDSKATYSWQTCPHMYRIHHRALSSFRLLSSFAGKHYRWSLYTIHLSRPWLISKLS